MTNTISKIEKDVFDYVGQKTHVDTGKITAKTMLFKEGIFDSMAFVLLIDFIEQNFKVKVKDEDLVEENFESVEAITGYISKKLEAMAN
jgi:acyl carrier protein